MSADLHCHTKLSDSSMSIDDLIVLAQKRGVDTIAVTDRDCLAGNVRAKLTGDRRGVNVVPGVELSASDPETGAEIGIIGYLCDSPDRLEGLCRRNMLARKKASQFMMLKIAQRYPITADLVLKCATGSTAVFEQHIMHALMECGLTDSIGGDLYKELFSPESPANVYVAPKFPSPEEIIAAIHEAGGVTILSHPGLCGGVEMAKALIPKGIDGFEAWHPDNSEALTKELITLARKNGLIVTGGSEFKGMYSTRPICIGECVTPETNLKALFSYKNKLRKAAAAQNQEK